MLVVAHEDPAFTDDPGVSGKALVLLGDADVKFGGVALRREKTLQNKRRAQARCARQQAGCHADGPGNSVDRSCSRFHARSPGTQSIDRGQVESDADRGDGRKSLEQQKPIAARQGKECRNASHG